MYWKMIKLKYAAIIFQIIYLHKKTIRDILQI